MPMCDFNNVASNFIEITLWYGSSPVNLLHISGISLYENAHGELFLWDLIFLANWDLSNIYLLSIVILKAPS